MEASNEQIQVRLNALEDKVHLLVQKHLEAREKIQTLEIENKQLKNEVASKEETLLNFYNQEKITKIVTSIAEDTPKKSELKFKINEYIKEIDKCIAALTEK
jgi:chromosome segregation ATPase